MLTRTQRARLRASSAAPNRLQAAMRLASVTQVQLAAGVGLTQGYVSKIKNGQYSDDLPGATMRAFAAFFGCSIEELFPPPAPISADPCIAERRDGERRREDRRMLPS